MSKKVWIDMSAEGKRDQEPARWWKTATVEFFKFKIGKLSDGELIELRDEIRGSLAVIQGQLESRGKTDFGWWKKASAAKGYMAEKQHLIKQELRGRQKGIDAKHGARLEIHEARKARKNECLKAVRESVAADDLPSAILKLVEYLEI